MDSSVGRPPPRSLNVLGHLLCSICECILRDPVQDCSGNRNCTACMNEILKKRPSVPCQECRSALTTKCFFKDAAVSNEVLSCPNENCDWQDKLKNYWAHFAHCLYKAVQCGGCDHEFNRLVIASHRLTCSKLLEYDAHVFSNKRNGMQETSRFSAAHYTELLKRRLGFSTLGADVTTGLNSFVGTLRQELRRNVTSDSSTLLQFPSENGIFQWKILPYSSLKEMTAPIYSSPFYTRENSYKMRLRLHINGHNAGRNSHISLYLVLIKGENDGNLQWPLIIKQVEFKLLNMYEGEDHTLKFTPARPFRKSAAISEFEGEEVGYDQFIEQGLVQCCHVYNNMVFLSCKIMD